MLRAWTSPFFGNRSPDLPPLSAARGWRSEEVVDNFIPAIGARDTNGEIVCGPTVNGP
jgi:hypothetical protein